MSLSFDPKDLEKLAGTLVSAGAPIIGGIVGGPFGAIIGGLVPQIAAQFGLAPDAPPSAVAAAVEADPQAGNKLAALEAMYADVRDARQQTISLAKDGSTIAWGAPVISVVIVVGFISLVGALIFKSVPDNQAVGMLFGALATAFGQVCNYWLGSSKGSSDKTAAMTAIIRSK